MFSKTRAFRYILPIVALLLVIPSCTVDSPYPETMYTMDILPGANATYNLGSPILQWNNIYVTSATFGGNLTFTGCVNSDLVPCANATYDLGSPTRWWDDAYILDLYAGNITGNVTGPDVVCATLVVAANDSLDASRADYQCDGVADDAEINAALVALPAIGGSVVLLEGNYACTANILVPASAMLRGQGMGTVLTWTGAAVTQGIEIQGDYARIKELKAVIGAGCGAGGTRPNIIYVDSHIGIYIQYVRLCGDKTVGNDGNVDRQNGILFDDTDGSNILSCYIENNYYFGIRLAYGSQYNGIEGNMVRTSLDGIYIDSSDGNDVVANAYQTNTERGIHLNDAHANNIECNMIRDNTYSGIYCLASDENLFIGNNSRDNDKHGIQFDGGDYNTITGNVFNDNDYNGITYSGINLNGTNWTTVTGNQCTGNGMHGIHVYRSDYCTITGNECNDQHTGDGIRVYGDGSGNADYNTVIANVCYGNADDGLELVGGIDCNYTVVDGNVLIGNGDDNYADGGNQSQFWGGTTESWFELRPELQQAKISGAGKPTLVSFGVYQGYSLPLYAVDEELFFGICVPQRWCGEEDIELHIYCAISQAEDTKNFNLELCWEHLTPGIDGIPATCNSVPMQTATGAGANAFQTYVVEFIIDYDIDPGDDIIVDDIVSMRIRRIAASANEIAGEIIVLHSGVVFTRDKVGTPVP